MVFTGKKIVIMIIAMLAGICFIPYHSVLPFSNIQSINIPDLILYLLLLITFVRIMLNPKFSFIRTPLNLPLILFFIVGLFSLIAGKFLFVYDFFQAYLEFKIMTYYLLPFVVINLIRNEADLKFLINGCLFLSIVVGLSLAIRSLVASTPVSEDILEFYYKFQSQGLLLEFWAFCCFFCLIIVKKVNVQYLCGVGVTCIFFILSFSRHWWIVLASSVLCVFFLAFKKFRINIFKIAYIFLVIFIFFASIALIGVQPFKKYKELISYRLHSLKWIDQTGSYEFRNIENNYAWEKIKEHPIFGIGFVRPYRPELYYGEDLIRHYVHNGYYWILLKFGLLGFIPFFWFSYVFLKRGIKNWTKLKENNYKAVVLGSVVSYLGIGLANLAAPHFMANWEVAVLGLSIGINESIYRVEYILKNA